MTASKEDYLKVIYEAGGLDAPVPNKAISDALGVAPASVTEMLAKLRGQGLISYTAYKGSRLTQEGLAACIDVVRSHQLWEVFLQRCLGYSWRESHEDAHLLEHVTSPRLAERLNAFLNYPETCPHGAAIPQNGVQGAGPALQPLSSLCEGARAKLSRVEEDGALLDYLEQSGLEIGATIAVTHVAPYEGPVTFLQNGVDITVSHKAARQIYVVPVP